MKENKFRYWSIKDEFYCDIIVMDINGNLHFKTSRQGDGDIVLRRPIIKGLYIPEQYTGLKDKNGKEIFEGDQFDTTALMSPDGVNSAHNINYWVPIKCTIIYKKTNFIGKYYIEQYSAYKYTFTDRVGFAHIPQSVEITGNIHEDKP